MHRPHDARSPVGSVQRGGHCRPPKPWNRVRAQWFGTASDVCVLRSAEVSAEVTPQEDVRTEGEPSPYGRRSLMRLREV